jgi:hypothetical protein
MYIETAKSEIMRYFNASILLQCLTTYNLEYELLSVLMHDDTVEHMMFVFYCNLSIFKVVESPTGNTT